MGTNKEIKLAIIGSRGFLTDYGGYETFVKKLAVGLMEKNFSITVFGITHYRDPKNDALYPGIERIWLPTIKLRFLEKVVSSLLAVLYASFLDFDVILSISVSPGLLLFLPRILGKKVVVNPDGLEWQRPKWSKFIAFWLRLSEWTAIASCNIVVADSQVIAKYVCEKFKKRTIFIPYGADTNLPQPDDNKILEKYELKPQGYFLQVCRLEPENNAHIVIREILNYDGDKQLVIIGDTPHSKSYKAKLIQCANHKVNFLGAIYGDDYKVILRNAYCYIHGHEAGGTNPSLLEAMASARCPIVVNVPYNCEVIADCGLRFSKDAGSLVKKLIALDKNENEVKTLGEKAFERVKHIYNWQSVINSYTKALASTL